MKKASVLAITAIIAMSVVLLASCDPKKATGTAEETAAEASVKAAKEVQTGFVLIKTEADKAAKILTDADDAAALEADSGKLRKAARAALTAVASKLNDMGDDGVLKLSTEAVAAAETVKDSQKKDTPAAKAVKAAKKVKAILNIDTNSEGTRKTAQENSEAFADAAVTDTADVNNLATLRAGATEVKNLINELKDLADKAVTAAEAVVKAEKQV